MADNVQNIQQPAQPIERPVREFIQVDTSTNAYMEKIHVFILGWL